MPRPSPYTDLPPRAFWRHAVADQDLRYLPDLWQPKTPVLPGQKIVTAGSCFAQQLGRALAAGPACRRLDTRRLWIIFRPNGEYLYRRDAAPMGFLGARWCADAARDLGRRGALL
jgi:hypothetical protein